MSDCSDCRQLESRLDTKDDMIKELTEQLAIEKKFCEGWKDHSAQLAALRDEAQKKWREEVHNGRIKCEGLIALMESQIWEEAALYAAPHHSSDPRPNSYSEEKVSIHATQCGLRDIFKARAKMARERK